MLPRSRGNAGPGAGATDPARQRGRRCKVAGRRSSRSAIPAHRVPV